MQCHSVRWNYSNPFHVACRNVVAGFFCCWLEGDAKDELGAGIGSLTTTFAAKAPGTPTLIGD